MSNEVVIPFGIKDNASGALRKVRGEAEKVGQSLKNAGDAARATMLGGGLGRIAGGMSALVPMLNGGSAAMKGLGVAAFGAGLALTAFNNVMSAQMQQMKDAIDIQKQYADAVRSGKDARQAFAAGAIAQAPGLRKLLVSGGDMKEVDYARSRGISYEDALAGESAVALFGVPGKKYALRNKAQNIALTGAMSYEAAVKKLVETRGNVDAIMADALGLNLTSGNLDAIHPVLFKFNCHT